MSETIERFQRLSTGELAPGMFVSQLDIPWLGSPFSAKGFVIETQAQLAELRQLCREVVIDRALSTGTHFVDMRHLAKAAKAVSAVARPPAGTENSFVRVLKALRKGQVLAAETLHAAYPALQYASTPRPVAAASQAKVSQALQRVKHWWSVGKSAAGQSATAASATEVSTDGEARPAVEIELVHIYPGFLTIEEEVRQVLTQIAAAQRVNLGPLTASLGHMLSSIERQPDALLWLSRLRQTEGHTYNKALFVCINMMAFANFLSLPRSQIMHLGLAGLLQDVGKINIPVAILQKPGALAASEFALVKQHVQASIDALRTHTDVSAEVLQIVEQHHERIDGSGYPAHLEDTEISLSGQVAGIMDTYCAMTTDKPYAKGMFSHEVLEELYLLSDEKFSATLVSQLIQFFGIYPVSSLVELNTGEVAVVIQQNRERRLQPRVMVLMSADRQRLMQPQILNLMHVPKSGTGEPYKITRGLSSDDFDLHPMSDYF